MNNDLSRQMSESDFQEFLTCGAILELDEDQFLLAWKPLGWASEPDISSYCFYIPDFFDEKNTPWLLLVRKAHLGRTELTELLQKIQTTPHLKPSREWVAPEKESFAICFELIQREFSKGKLEKAVPVVFAKSPGTMQTAEKAHILKELMDQNSSALIYGYWWEDSGMLGATPELLFDMDRSQLKSMALAGTSNEPGRLLSDEKLQREHDLVLKDIKHQLSTFGSVDVGPTKEVAYGPLWHLKTELKVPLQSKADFSRVCTHLHPTPALGVSPRSFGWKWLKELGGWSRRASFGAPFGIRNPDGGGRALVAIRSVQWDSDDCLIPTGCGLLADSDLDMEWQELTDKREAVKSALGL